MIRSLNEPTRTEPPLFIEEVTDSVAIARHRMKLEHFSRNSDWLAGHWSELLPRAAGKFVVVAGQEAMIAESAEQAWGWAGTTHPEDQGALVRYVLPGQGPRIYANHRSLVAVR